MGGLVTGEYTINLNNPDPFDVNLNGNMDVGLNTFLTGNEKSPITTLMLGDASRPMSALIKGDPKNPVALSFELMNLPRFKLEDIKEMTKIRMHLPHYSQFCFKILGVDLFSFCLSGEAQAITEPYIPNAHEKCEINCCEIDTSPFPEKEIKQ